MFTDSTCPDSTCKYRNRLGYCTVTVCVAVSKTVAIREQTKTPTIEAVPVVHGKWEWLSSTYDRTPCEKRYRCSECHHETITHVHDPWEKYCPNCGAKMDKEETDVRLDQAD